MCECGCVSNDEHYKFPGPGDTYYLLTLSGGCGDCDAPAGVCIRHIKPGEFNYWWYKNKENRDGLLTFEMWGDGSGGAAVKTGMVQSEFVKSARGHLIGIDPKDFGDNDGLIDGFGADVILEEMFDDVASRLRPTVIVPASDENRS